MSLAGGCACHTPLLLSTYCNEYGRNTVSHKHDIDGPDGDILDRVYFCSDFCHKSWCQNQNLHEYGGWDGCHELEYDTPCEACGENIPGYFDSVIRFRRGEHRW